MNFALHLPPFCRPDWEQKHRPDLVRLGLQSFLLDCISTAVH
jgi:hypothetical protein